MFFIHCICGSPMRSLNPSDPSIKICTDTECLAISKSSTDVIKTIRKCPIPDTDYIHNPRNNVRPHTIKCPTCGYNSLHVDGSKKYADFNSKVTGYKGIYTMRNVYITCRHCKSQHSGMVTGLSLIKSLKEI